MKPLVSRWVRIRVAFVALSFILGLSLILLRAVQLQVIDQAHLAALAARQHRTEIQVAPKRGPIYDRNMQELAVSLEVESIHARPRELRSAEDAAKRLAPVVGVDPSKLLARFKGKSPFVWVKRQATPTEATAVRALGIEGVGFTREGRRFYPHRSLGGKLLGFVGMDGEGLEGLELQHDQVLRGKTERLHAMRDALRRRILVDGLEPGGAAEGHGIILTIDHAIQYIADSAIQTAVENARARRGIAVVMDPRTGDILAIAESPGFNPNVYAEAAPENRHCWAFCSTFEPGSTFKIFVVAAALEAGAVRHDQRVYCEGGAYRVGKHTIHDVHPYGWLDLAGVVKHSSNIGALKIADRLGTEDFYRYIRAFGFGSRSGAGFPGDLPGLLPPVKQWKNITRSTIAFGQGIAVTPVQITAAVSAIANGGTLLQPRLVMAKVDQKGDVVASYEPRAVRRVISKETATLLTAFMKGVTEEGGTGTAARAPGYAVAGKTGTAQKVQEGKRGYSSKRVGSFIGFVPADNPRLAISVIIDEPRGIPYGGRVAAPAFREIAEKALPYMGVAPDQDSPESLRAAVEAQAPLKARGEAGRLPVHRAPAAPAAITAEGKAAAEKAPPGVETVALAPRVPDFHGLSIRDALILAEAQNIALEIEGSGLAHAQSLEAGEPLEPGAIIKIKFSPPGSS